MPYIVPIDQARVQYPEYNFIDALTPSEQKAAFHVVNNSGDHYCLKLISPDYQTERLDREIRALLTISHSNVVTMVDYTRSFHRGLQRHHIIEEYIEGCDLSSYITPGNCWPVQNTAAFFAAVCDGLYAIHQADIIHRDLKPSNIRVRSDGQPVIIDLGVARHLTLPDLTSYCQGAEIGTPLYFSPEQCCGTRDDIDPRTDLFAVGILIFQALTGRHPFRISSMGLYDAICSSYEYLQFSEFSALSPQWKLIVGRLLEKERAKRPQNAAQVAALLRKVGGII